MMRDHPYQPSIMIRFFIVSGILLAYSTVIFSYTPLQNDVVHICCYSNDPSAYTPNCYDCNSMVYKNALMACMNSTELPKNITYKAATCLEKNCQIQPPKPPESEDLKNNPFIDIVSKILAIVRNKRSVFDNNIDGSSGNKPACSERSSDFSIDRGHANEISGTRVHRMIAAIRSCIIKPSSLCFEK